MSTMFEGVPLRRRPDPHAREAHLNNKIDLEKLLLRTRESGKMAEAAVINFLNIYFRNYIRVRAATVEEDASRIVTDKGRQIDIIVYDLRDRPLLCVQVTAQKDPKILNEKMQQLKDSPFVRLEEMTQYDVAIPKALVCLDPEAVVSYNKDRNFKKHLDIGEKIVDDIQKSLRFVDSKTKNPKEKQRAKDALSVFEGKNQTWH
jgi:hypothetical protein